jgi:hypothetical protein
METKKPICTHLLQGALGEQVQDGIPQDMQRLLITFV